jgi:UDP-N-acetylglucosamine/UDP-N-acetylgalactosamine diphosphorylase
LTANGATVATDSSGRPESALEVSPLFGYDEDSFADAWGTLSTKPAVVDGLYLA